MTARLKSGTPMFACDAALRIVAWNRGAEKLTGIPAREAVGEPCWWVLSGRDDDGSLVCHQGCSNARLAREGWPVASHVLNIKGPAGPKRIAVDVVSSVDDSSFAMIHLLRETRQRRPGVLEPGGKTRLTPRQREVLGLLGEGLPARKIAGRLGITEITVRNHIRAVLAELGVHSQLQAVAKARRAGLL
jgi:DNA-binding CsgD family transcriptional regulator